MKVKDTPQFKECQRLLKLKSEQLNSVRRDLARLQPDEVGDGDR